MLSKIYRELKEKMAAIISQLQEELAGLRAGRASAGLVENIKVNYYGTPTPLKQTAQITVPEANQILITPFDPGSAGEIEKAIREAKIGIEPINDGKNIRLVLPPMTEERRQEILKGVKQRAEDARIALRNLRQQSWEEIQRLEKQKQITEDDKYDGEAEVNRIITDYNEQVNSLVAAKEKEVKLT